MDNFIIKKKPKVVGTSCNFYASGENNDFVKKIMKDENMKPTEFFNQMIEKFKAHYEKNGLY